MRERNAALTERNTVTQQKEQPFFVYTLHPVSLVSNMRLIRGLGWSEINVEGFPWSISVRLVIAEEVASGGAALGAALLMLLHRGWLTFHRRHHTCVLYALRLAPSVVPPRAFWFRFCNQSPSRSGWGSGFSVRVPWAPSIFIPSRQRVSLVSIQTTGETLSSKEQTRIANTIGYETAYISSV